MAEQLAYEDTGSATGAPLVFLHGITANRAHWRPVVERLEDRHRCINVDLLGHGASPQGSDSALFGQVGAVRTLMDQLELEAPVLVGHSYGGFVATALAAMAPLRGVVNVDQPFDMTAFRDVLGPLEERLRGDDFAAAWDEFVAWEGIDRVPQERMALTRDNIAPRQEVVLEVWSAVLDTPADELMAQVESLLPLVASPYLGIFGSELSATERRLQGLIPGATVEVWDGLGHFIQLVDPERTAARISSFVASLV
ncbi:MAG: alpha/beta fold hydrolase [Actinomycetota bacterium]